MTRVFDSRSDGAILVSLFLVLLSVQTSPLARCQDTHDIVSPPGEKSVEPVRTFVVLSEQQLVDCHMVDQASDQELLESRVWDRRPRPCANLRLPVARARPPRRSPKHVDHHDARSAVIDGGGRPCALRCSQ